MPLQVQCPCGKRLQIPDSAAGKNVKCPNCKTVLAIQAPAPAVVEEDEEFEVVEEPKPKPKPAEKKPVKAAVADDDDDEEDEDDDDNPKPRSKSKSKSGSLLKGIKNAAVGQLGGRPDYEEEDEDDEPRKKKGKKGKKKKRKSDEDEDAYWKTPQGMMLNGLGLIGLGIGGIAMYFLSDEQPKPVYAIIAGIICIGCGIGSIITGYTKQQNAGKKGDDDDD